jgi:penicillin-binding protein 2
LARPKSIFGYLEGVAIHKPKRNLADHERWTEAILPADADASAMEGETNRRPLWYVGVAVGLLLVVLGLRMAQLQIVGGSHNLALADGNRTRTKVIRAPRGIIYDRNHTILATNQPSYDITVVPQQLPRSAAARGREYNALGNLLGVKPSDIQAKAELVCSSKQPDCLDTPVPQLAITDIDRDHALLFDQSSLSFAGFSLDVNPVRQYMDNGVLAQLLGYTGRVSSTDLEDHPDYGPTDYIGKTGVEDQYESLLRGTDGGQQTEVDASGRPVKVLADKTPQSGQSLVLSIDESLQEQLAKALQDAMNADGAAHPTRAAGVAINPNTGEVLALVSLPTYDHNLFTKGISQQDFTRLINDKAQPLFNKAIGGTYPTGSIIKPLVASAGLQAGTLTTSSTINDIGYLDVANENDPNAPHQQFHSYEAGGFGAVNLFKAMAVSSNVFFMAVGGGYNGNIGHIVGLGVDRLTHYYKDFGLGQKTGIDLPGESAGLVPTRDWKKTTLNEPWFLGDTYNISVGQGNMQVTPLQMAVAISSIANGGKLIQPHILDSVLGPNGQVIKKVQPDITRQNFIDADKLAIVRQAMRGVVSTPGGTACCLIEKQVPVHVAAKTGTAENGSSQAHAWFEAFAPYEDPQIVIVALVEHGGEGGFVAAPAVRQTLSWYFTQGAGKTIGPRSF